MNTSFSKFLTISIIFFLSAGVFAQTNREINDSLRIVAKAQIKKLKSGVLLFRLDSKQSQIAYYEKHGNFSAAQELKERTHKFNLLLIQGMRESFTFCPIYFFDGEYTDDLLAKNFDKIVYYSDDLKKDPTIQLTDDMKYLVAEYSYTVDEVEYNGSDAYANTSNLGVPAIVVMDEKLNQSKKPFPYYCKFTSKLLTINKLNTKIKKWNARLEQYSASSSKSS